MERVQRVTRRLLDQRGSQRLRELALHLSGALEPDDGDDERELRRAAADDAISIGVASAYVLGRCDGTADAWRTQRVDVVWTGPQLVSAPVRSTAAVLIDIIAMSQRDLILMTYSAKPHEAIRQALKAASTRGVDVDIVVETLGGAGAAMSGSEPAAAFQGIRGVKLWHWPQSRRINDSAKMHAKVAVADGLALLVSSANLTQSGVTNNLEAGLLVHGGTAPVRAQEYVRSLQSQGLLERLR